MYANFDKNSAKPSLNITEIFTSWADNPGYPVVNVERNYSTEEISVTQVGLVLFLLNVLLVYNLEKSMIQITRTDFSIIIFIYTLST